MPGYDGYDISHNKDGSITFVCSPKDVGTYRISVERDGQILNGTVDVIVEYFTFKINFLYIKSGSFKVR